jgi:hypothetical protein
MTYVRTILERLLEEKLPSINLPSTVPTNYPSLRRLCNNSNSLADELDPDSKDPRYFIKLHFTLIFILIFTFFFLFYYANLLSNIKVVKFIYSVLFRK